MHAMVLNEIGRPLVWTERPLPRPRRGEVLVRVAACAVCRTDLHVVDGKLPRIKLPLVPGHEVVGHVQELGEGVSEWKVGERIGIPWLAGTCGTCLHCRLGQENLCESAVFHGYTRDGGFATHLVADARFCLRLPSTYGDEEAAPLLCAGLIGYRSLHKAGQAGTIGIYGFGAAAHLITQLADAEGRKILAFTRPGDERAQTFAREMGAAWAGSTLDTPPEPLDAAIIFAPAGELVPVALRAVRPGGCVVCGGIHMSDVPGFPYQSLWGERSLTSVANMTRQDGKAFMAAARTVRLRVSTTSYPLIEANRALADLRAGQLCGAAVLIPPLSP